MIVFKSYDVLRSYMDVQKHYKLRIIEKWIIQKYKQIVITCAHERREYPSVHDVIPLRGLDIRSRIYTYPETVVSEINKKWTYDPLRTDLKCAVLHDIGKGIHIHLQVCDNTIKNY